MLGDPVGGIDPSGLVHCIYTIKSHSLLCYSNDMQNILITDNVFSGDGECKNSIKTDCLEKEEAHGPIPPGNYIIYPNKSPGHKGWWAIKSQYWIPKISGLAYKFGFIRAGFNFHMGSLSFGCITFPASYNNKLAKKLFDRLSRMFKIDAPKNTLFVIEGF